MNRSPLCRNDGYTFIELLVAITLLGLIIAPFLGLFGTSYSAIGRAGQQSTAVNLCRDRMEWVKARGFSYFSPYPNSNGAITLIEEDLPEEPGYRRITEVSTIHISPPGQPDQEIPLLHVTVTVFFTAGDREYSEKVETYIAEY